MRARWFGWRPRVIGLGVLFLLVLGVTTVLDFDPDPFALLLVTTLLCGTAWLVLDVLDIALDAGVAAWRDRAPGAPPRREDPRTVRFDRIVQSHLTAREPSPALAEALVELARLRDPALERPGPAEVVATLGDPGRRPARLTPHEIDHHLSRIEDA